MYWYLIHTKPRQEQQALKQLEQQGYTCYLPLLRCEKAARGRIQNKLEALFPRYLFIQLEEGLHAQSWTPIRSTPGVSRLVRFGNSPARVPTSLIEQLRMHEAEHCKVVPLFSQGQRVEIQQGPFKGIEGLFQSHDGTQRALVLIELMSQQVRVPTPLTALRAKN